MSKHILKKFLEHEKPVYQVIIGNFSFGRKSFLSSKLKKRFYTLKSFKRFYAFTFEKFAR